MQHWSKADMLFCWGVHKPAGISEIFIKHKSKLHVHIIMDISLMMTAKIKQHVQFSSDMSWFRYKEKRMVGVEKESLGSP